MSDGDELTRADLEIDIAQALGPMPGHAVRARAFLRAGRMVDPRGFGLHRLSAPFSCQCRLGARCDGGRDYCYTIAPPISVKKVTRSL
jgi:hypothetical protein